jgi:predicted DNA-binding protein with PD1-like motif
MKYSECRRGRTFIIRLEHGDELHTEIEKFAREMSVTAGMLIVVGGADKGSTLVVGPDRGDTFPVTPMTRVLENVHEITGTGTLFPDENGSPLLHMHIASGRGKETTTGCIRKGVKVWQVMEVILIELTHSESARALDAETGFHLLTP